MESTNVESKNKTTNSGTKKIVPVTGWDLNSKMSRDDWEQWAKEAELKDEAAVRFAKHATEKEWLKISQMTRENLSDKTKFPEEILSDGARDLLITFANTGHLKSLGGWIPDLTTQCVEPNPGPTFLAMLQEPKLQGQFTKEEWDTIPWAALFKVISSQDSAIKTEADADTADIQSYLDANQPATNALQSLGFTRPAARALMKYLNDHQQGLLPHLSHLFMNAE